MSLQRQVISVKKCFYFSIKFVRKEPIFDRENDLRFEIFKEFIVPTR